MVCDNGNHPHINENVYNNTTNGIKYAKMSLLFDVVLLIISGYLDIYFKYSSQFPISVHEPSLTGYTPTRRPSFTSFSIK